MRRVALISDIHGNRIALDAVFEDMRTQDVEAVYCLGDVVGYGPEPMVCMEKVIKACDREHMIMGNHDHAVVHEPIGFNRSARQAALWTNKVAKPGALNWFGRKRRQWAWLTSLPTSFTQERALFVHASPRQHLEEYILEEHTKGISFTGEDPQLLLQENFELVDQVAFIGHSHRPGLITGDDYSWHTLREMDYHWVLDERPAIVNIGSVGQPRDMDPRSCYVIYDGKEVWWRRVEYDIEAVRRMIISNSALDDRLGDRLLDGR
ncbi:MAG: metallophosphoesterase family protein [Planctomycetota bacterium]|jgi:hypothetical protein|nr:metallophosphoesterase family protein [Planctomycetota bacterium]